MLRLRVSPAIGRAEFMVRTTATANLRLFDTSGRLVRRLVGSGSPGERTLVWDGRDEHGEPSAPGVYVAFLDMGASSLSRRVVFLR
jgi:hypothetical protein